uniref:Uncharacterized protein n=1 Tax=Anopheles funestus TaxID=62324 RepID=A0A4Y0BSY3_ANOFN
MADGFPQLDLPVLAPFAWKELHVKDFNNNMLRFNAELKDGITRGLNQFNITSLNVHIPSRKLDFKLTFPSVQTIGRYVAKGQLAGFVPFDRSGSFMSVNACDIVRDELQRGLQTRTYILH